MNSVTRGIKKSAFILAVFAGILCIGLSANGEIITNPDLALTIITRSVLCAMAVWLIAIIVFDIVIKGIVDEIDVETIDPLEGGFLQRISDEKARSGYHVPPPGGD